jgi:hypothetical protein
MPILPSRLRALVVALPLTASLGGCLSWSRRPVDPPEPERFHFLGGPVRVTRTGGGPLVLVGVTVDRDSLYGNEYKKPHGRVTIPVSDVRKVETQRVDPLKVAALAVGSAAAAVTVVATFLYHSECSCVKAP